MGLAALVDGDHRAAITTSLRLPSAVLGGELDGADDRPVFYAANRGAFVDLAAGLGHALHQPVRCSGPRAPVPDGADDEARSTLRRHAAAAGIELHVHAAQILRG